jgi:hypothetical protein
MPLVMLLGLTLTSCDKLPEGFGRRPYIKLGPKSVFTADELAVLAKLSTENPGLAKKIISRNNEMAEAIKIYNQKANEFNRNLLKQIGYNDDDVRRMEPEPESP